MGFGGGVLLSVLAFELTEEAYIHGGFTSSATGFIAGAIIFSTVNWFLSGRGAKHRKRCSQCVVQFPEYKKGGNETAIAIGSIMDDIPEAIIVGISLAGGVAIGKAVLIGFFLANIQEFQEWVLFQREHYFRHLLTALHILIKYYQEQGKIKKALDYAYRQANMAPL